MVAFVIPSARGIFGAEPVTVSVSMPGIFAAPHDIAGANGYGQARRK